MKKVYPQPTKLVSEQGAYEQVHYLLNVFGGAVEAFVTRKNDDLLKKTINVLDILTKREWTPSASATSEDLYRRVVDFVAGMTDRYASNLHKNLIGTSLTMR